MLSSFDIGNVRVSPNLVLAPMSGVTNSCFRKLIRGENPGALGLAVTEFISIEGLTRRNGRSLQMMEYGEEDRPISIQIFGYDIDRMVEAAKMVEDTGANIVDINCGCPVPKVVKRGGGCELMRQTFHLNKILTRVVKAVSIPVTLKIRSGWDDESRNALDVGRMAEDAGVAMLAVHGRTRKALYRGIADWEIVAQVADELKIPVVGSGDIIDVDSAKQALLSGVAGIMIGRGAMANPWIFAEIAAAVRGEPFERPGVLETIELLERYSLILSERMPERGVTGKMKQLASQATRQLKGSSKARRAICTSQSLAEMLEVLEQWREYVLSDGSEGAAIISTAQELPLGELAP